jgi:hypothetical protein
MSLETEFSFTLPRGYVDGDGDLHRDGVMRLATARDELEPLRDPRVADNEAYLTVIVLSRVITQLGSIGQVTPKVIEGLFAADLAFLQDFYEAANFGGPDDVAAVVAAYAPKPAAVAVVAPSGAGASARGRARKAS